MTRIDKTFKLAQQGLSVGEAMRQAGYGKGYAKNPQLLKRSDQWQKLLAERLPDDELLIAHHNALKATKWNDFTGEREADHQIRLKAATEGYKLKGRLLDSNGNSSGNMQINIVFDGSGYIPPDNVLNLKPTLKTVATTQTKSRQPSNVAQ